MKRLLAPFLAALLATAPIRASAQLPLLGVGPGTLATSAPAGYTGPGDIVTGAIMWWGLRAYSTATRGNNAANICLPLDASCINVATDATTGALNLGAITTLGCNNTTAICTIKTLYDQTGHSQDVTNATIALRPILTLSCTGTLPCATCNGTSQYLVSGSVVSQAQPFTANSAASVAASHPFLSGLTGNGNASFGYTSTADTLSVYASGGIVNQGGATDGTWHGVGGIFNGTSSIAWVDTTQSTPANAGTTGLTSWQPSFCTGFDYFKGSVFELGIWPSIFSTPNINSMNANQHAYGIY